MQKIRKPLFASTPKKRPAMELCNAKRQNTKRLSHL